MDPSDLKTLSHHLTRGRRDVVYFAYYFLGLKLHPGQMAFLRGATANVNLLVPGNRWGKTVAKYYQDFLPERYKSHNEQLTDKVIDEYRIEGTPFTSGIINKNNPLKYHFDSGNFKGVYSCMITVKHDTSGGNLSMPEYELGFNLSK